MATKRSASPPCGDDQPVAKAARTVESLDPTEGGGGAAADDEIDTWFVIPPVRCANWQIVQLDIKCGIRCTLADIDRLGSNFFDALVHEAERDGSNRVIIPNGTFTSGAVMHAAMAVQLSAAGSATFAPRNTSEIMIAYFKLDILKTPVGPNFTRTVLKVAGGITPAVRMEIGRICHMPDQERQGLLELAGAWKKGDSCAPFVSHIADLMQLFVASLALKTKLAAHNKGGLLYLDYREVEDLNVAFGLNGTNDDSGVAVCGRTFDDA